VARTRRRVYLIDASIYIFRAYFSVPDDVTNAAGEPINALHGFAGFLAGFLQEVNPAHVAVVFDESLTTSFRNDIYPAYKANRETPPEDLKQQFVWCRRLIESLGLPGFSSDRFEADDLIGTLAAQLRNKGFGVVILSADKDLAQLVEAGDMVWDYVRNRKHRHADIKKWLGVEAHQVADWLALTGDTVDNIPGIPGIGAKTAAALLEAFGSLDQLYANLDAVAGSGLRGAARVQKLLEMHEDKARLARRLTGITVDPGIQVGIRDVQRRKVNDNELTAVCKELGLGRMTQQRLLRVINRYPVSHGKISVSRLCVFVREWIFTGRCVLCHLYGNIHMMSLWNTIAADIAAATGTQAKLRQRGSVGGGCINQAQRIDYGDTRYFVKLNTATRVDMFAAEFEGLQALRQCAALHIPKPVCYGADGDSAYIVMENLELGGHGDPAALGEGLAGLHRVTQSQFGWHRDNTIGSTLQVNTLSDDWVGFYREYRLQFQFALAARHGCPGSLVSQGERLMDDFHILFDSYTPEASLLHGDLWSGNHAYTSDGEPTIFDPAVYYGDHEADLAMTELFGGFGRNFYTAYNNAWPIDPGYKIRKTLYNLYHILNHFNLFGGSYASQAEDMVESLLSELG